ncbi:MAG: tetratricopeptide repeat-containing protein [Frankiaceae bacterium]
MSQQIAFMVMPFGQKPTGLTGDGVPSVVDFDALWHRVHQPVLEELGFRAVRADADIGALIVVEMIQRLVLADVVVADVSLANSNVYYEVGVRHAAECTGCVLVAASWAQPVFDMAQMRRLSYPLTDGSCPAPNVEAARAALRAGLSPLLNGPSPVCVALPGYPDRKDGSAPAFADVVDELSGFETDIRAIRLATSDEARKSRTRDLVAAYGAKPAIRESVVLELIAAIRDNVGWPEVLAYVDDLPDRLQRHPTVVEQRQLALAKTGRVEESAAALQGLIERSGGTSERWGLLGGRYKQLMRAAPEGSDERRRYLERAIDAYERGMALDLNDYYPSSNLPRLYRIRGKEGDEKRATETATVAMTACRASMAIRPDDEWARPTLIGAAFDSGDVDGARALLDEIRLQGASQFNLEATIDDLAHSVRLHEQSDVRAGLDEVLAAMRRLVGP